MGAVQLFLARIFKNSVVTGYDCFAAGFFYNLTRRYRANMRTFKHNATGYSLVSDETGSLPPPKRRTASLVHACRRFLIPLAVVSSFCAGVVTTIIAQSSFPTRDLGVSLPPSPDGAPAIPYLAQTFSYNRTFGADPTDNKLTEDAWDSIVPLGQGTVRLSKDGSQTTYYTLSVMHQLHCLWSIHRGFYTALHADPSEVDVQDFPHIRHCFDYIRQALMCSADTTLEPVDANLGGVTGWNGTHVCRDYGVLAAWAEDHRTNNLKGFREAHKAHQGHGASQS